MKAFADSPFWRAIAVAAVVALFAVAFRGSDAPAEAFASSAYAQPGQPPAGVVQMMPSMPGAIPSIAITSAIQEQNGSCAVVAVVPKAGGGLQFAMMTGVNLRSLGAVQTRDIPNTK
ncbi:MAG: hypothetical protein RLY93_16025 [Sumerlaeia bacterium]